VVGCDVLRRVNVVLVGEVAPGARIGRHDHEGDGTDAIEAAVARDNVIDAMDYVLMYDVQRRKDVCL
jgi:ketol-acid reductoisomerase